MLFRSQLMIELPDNWRGFSGFFGVDISVYNKMFPDNFDMVQGRFLQGDGEGVILNEKTWMSIRDDAKVTLKVGDPVKITSMGGGGTKIKNLPLIGVIRFKSTNSSLQRMGFMDLSSLRYMRGMVVGAASQVKVSAEDSKFLDSAGTGDLDSLFGDSAIATTVPAGSTTALTEDKLNGILGDTSKRAELNKADAGAWEYTLIRVKDGVDVDSVITSMNAHFKEADWKLKAVDWEGAAGYVASLVKAFQLVFLILVLIISVVSIIVIMNTMVVSIIERTGEIGTMRALGAQKGYIRGIFLTETFTLSIVGGLVGLLVGSVLLLVLHTTGMASPNPLFDLVLGGKILYPVLSLSSAAWALVIMVAVGLLSSLYPTMIALRITPVKAMSNNN